uniref:Lipoprotein n=1 Tax=Marinomonas sp. (strain MWYL1) TaxID=400668 RepID=A6VSP1_MARMS
MKIKLLLILATLFILTGCEEKPFYVASIGNVGSLDGPYSMGEISVADVLGGGVGFGYGAVNGYPGASADIGRMGVPKNIEGYWAKKYPEGGFQYYYRISADTNSELAEKKIRTLQNYYQNFKGSIGRMQVVVQEERIQVIYTQGCYAYRMDCNQKEGSDPNQWVVRSPSDSTDVVVLFDGKGVMSLTPFPDSPYEN